MLPTGPNSLHGGAARRLVLTTGFLHWRCWYERRGCHFQWPLRGSITSTAKPARYGVVTGHNRQWWQPISYNGNRLCSRVSAAGIFWKMAARPAAETGPGSQDPGEPYTLFLDRAFCFLGTTSHPAEYLQARQLAHICQHAQAALGYCGVQHVTVGVMPSRGRRRPSFQMAPFIIPPPLGWKVLNTANRGHRRTRFWDGELTRTLAGSILPNGHDGT